jgi:hypothetical protein
MSANTAASSTPGPQPQLQPQPGTLSEALDKIAKLETDRIRLEKDQIRLEKDIKDLKDSQSKLNYRGINI